MPALGMPGKMQKGDCWNLPVEKRDDMRGPTLHRFLVRPVSGGLKELFPSETSHFPSLCSLSPLCLSKTPGARMLPRGVPTVSETSVSLGWHGSPHYCRLVSSWTLWEAVVSPCNQKAEGVNHITGCNEEFDSCNKTIQLLFTFIIVPAIAMEQKSFLKKRICHQHSFIVSPGNLGLCFSRINCTGKFAIKITLLQKLPFPITSCQISL